MIFIFLEVLLLLLRNTNRLPKKKNIRIMFLIIILLIENIHFLKESLCTYIYIRYIFL